MSIAEADPLPNPPVAPRVAHTEVRYGETIQDYYYWLRDKSDPRVMQYLKSENDYTEALTKASKPFEDALYKEMLGRIKQTDLTVPVQEGGYFYYSRTEEGKQYPILCRRKGSAEGPEQVLLDINEFAKDHKFAAVGSASRSDDQNLCAYTTDFEGYRQFHLYVKDFRSGEVLPDAAERVISHYRDGEVMTAKSSPNFARCAAA